MKTEEIKELFSKFESIVCDYNGVECWSARELYKLLGYSQWRNFLPSVEKAREACRNAGEDVLHHFADARKMVDIGSGSQRPIEKQDRELKGTGTHEFLQGFATHIGAIIATFD